MRLSEVLSKQITTNYSQIEGFTENKKIGFGKQKRITVGKIALNFFCSNCNDNRTFCSSEDLFCIGVSDNMISIDCALRCPLCDSSVQLWFLVESKNDIFGPSPNVRVIKRSEKLSGTVSLRKDGYDNYAELLDKSQRAYREGLGAGAVIYLRKVFEGITVQAANAANINTKTDKGRRKPFKSLLKEVDMEKSIIPKEFSENSYRLFGELSDVVHGDHDDRIVLQKYDALRRLVIGIIDNVKNNDELMSAIGSLGWNDDGGTQ